MLRAHSHREASMIRDNPLLKKMIETGEERMGKLATQLLSNETFMNALQKAVTAAIQTKGVVEQGVQAALGSMNIPTSADVKKLESKIEELERVFESLTSKISELQAQKAEPASGPAASAPAKDASAPVTSGS
jgi:hypothetical protein